MTNIPTSASTAAGDAPRSNPLRNLNVSARFWVALVLVLLVMVVGFAGYFYPTGPTEKVGGLYDPPGSGVPLGTDNFGYDVLAVLMAGTRTSLIIGLVAGTIATTLGVVIGLLAGFVGGWLEEMLMGATNVVLAIPSIIVLILISISLPQANLWTLAIVIGITAWPWTARAVRSQSSSVATREHIDIARLSGARLPSILLVDVMPYILSYIVMAFVLQISGAILAESSLSMLGLGPANTQSLGSQLHWALAFQATASGAWWAFLPPTILLTMVSFGFLLLQSSLDELFNPRLRRGKRRAMKRAAAERARAAAQLASAASHDDAGDAGTVSTDGPARATAGVTAAVSTTAGSPAPAARTDSTTEAGDPR